MSGSKRSLQARILLTCLLTQVLCSFSQDLNKDYNRLLSSGNLPELFIQTFSGKIRAVEERAKHNGSDSTFYKHKDFSEENIFDTDHILRNGNVLFNDSISLYVNKVLDEILKNDTAFRNQLHLLVVKSGSANAFSFDDGIILVYTGLLSQLENEAELAFVLCHELIHFRKRHSVNAYLNYLNLSDKSYRKSRTGAELLHYSRDQETEADTAGLALFRNTRYDYSAVRSAFDVMQYAYLPFDEQVFPKSFLEDEQLHFPSSYFLVKTAPVKNEENYDDSRSTHPNIRKRRSSVLHLLDSTCSNTGRKKFLVSEQSFFRTRELARFETCRLYLLTLNYPDAIYTSFLLQHSYPDNIFLKKVMAKSLYGVAAYKENRYKDRYKNEVFSSGPDFELKPYDQVEGYSQQVYYLLHKLSSGEALVLALRYSWKLNVTLNYQDEEIKRICDSLFVLLIQGEKKDINDFSARSRAEVLHDDSLKTIQESALLKTPNDSSGLRSKYQKIRAEQRKESGPDTESDVLGDFSEYAFSDLLKDPRFRERFRYFMDKPPGKSNADTYNKHLLGEKNARKLVHFGKALGIGKVIITEPFFYSIKVNGAQKLNLKKTEKGITELRKTIREDAAKAGLDFVFMDPLQFKADETERYNDFSKINDWFNERLEHGYHSEMLGSCSEDMKELAIKYGTSSFLWTGVVSVTEGGTSSRGTYIYLILYDVCSEKVLFSQSRAVKSRNSQAVLHSNYYDLFNQIHQQPDREKDKK
ncbi:MAG: M48 family metallopeptidase [Bacteroidia bacterium]